MTKQFFDKEIALIAKIIADKYRPKRIILFGSLAWGKPKDYSDVDLFVIKESKERRPLRSGQIYELLWENYPYNLPIDILVYTPKEIRKREVIGDPFIKKIMRQGKVLYEKN